MRCFIGHQEIKIFKKVLKKTPLHQKLEQKYKIEKVLPELERKKRELAKIRNILKPMNMSEISQHAIK